MNKKNIALILAGILIQVLEFTVNIGGARVDIFSDIIAYALIIIGVMPLVPRNRLFKKTKNSAIKGLIVSVIVQAVNFYDFGEYASTMDTFTRGLTTIFAIYVTYYFTESIMLESKRQDKAALTRNFRITWAVLGIFIFVSYIAFMSNVSIASILVQALVLVCTIYYSSVVFTACNQLYMEGIPTKKPAAK